MRHPDSLGKVGIFATGGGFRVAVQFGFIKELIRRGVRIDHLVGVSAPVLPFAKLSEAQCQAELARKAEEVEQLLLALERAGPQAVFRFSKFDFGKKLLFAGKSLMDKSGLESLLRNYNPRKTITSPIDFDICVFDHEDRTQKIFSNRNLLFQEYHEKWRQLCIASASLLPFFEASVVDGRRYSDGGYINLKQVGRCGCDTVFVIFSRPKHYKSMAFSPDSFLARRFPWLPLFMEVHESGLYKIESEEVARLRDRMELDTKNRLLAKLRDGNWLVRKMIKLAGTGLSYLFQGATKPVRVVIVYVERIPETLTAIDFAPGDITKAVKLGTELAKDELQKLLKD